MKTVLRTFRGDDGLYLHKDDVAGALERLASFYERQGTDNPSFDRGVVAGLREAARAIGEAQAE